MMSSYRFSYGPRHMVAKAKDASPLPFSPEKNEGGGESNPPADRRWVAEQPVVWTMAARESGQRATRLGTGAKDSEPMPLSSSVVHATCDHIVWESWQDAHPYSVGTMVGQLNACQSARSDEKSTEYLNLHGERGTC